MKKLSIYKKLMLAVLLLGSMGIVAQVPLNDSRTIWQHLTGTGEHQEFPEQKMERTNLDQAWKELQKLSAVFTSDTMTVSGVLKLYDNMDEEGISETQNFLYQRSGSSQRMRLDSFDRIEIQNTHVLIDHIEKEVAVRASSSLDSSVAAMRLLSEDKFKEILEKDGTTASFEMKDGLRILHLIPGTRDAVNEYSIYYDPQTYDIKKFLVSYTSFPYQDYQETDSPKQVKSTETKTAEQDAVNDEDETEIDANITEYIVEYEFRKKEKGNSFNFSENELFKLEQGSIAFRGKIATYKRTDY